MDLISCEFSEPDYHHLALTCTRLRSLTLGATTDAIVKAIVTHNHELEQLSIYCSSKLSSRAIKMIAEHCPKLTTLKLKCSEKISDRSIETVLRYTYHTFMYQFMLSLYLLTCVAFDERNCPNLQELSLFGCKKIKGTAFRMFLTSKTSSKKRPFRLQNLNLSYCELSKKGFKTLTKVCQLKLCESEIECVRECV